MICDNKKVFRAKERALDFSIKAENEHMEIDNITAIFVDGRKDNTLTLFHVEVNDTYWKHLINEHHVTVTEEPKGRNSSHYTPDKTITEKRAKECAISLFDWMKDRGIDASLKVIGCDTTNEMQG